MCVAPHLIMKGADIKSVQYFICIYMCFSQYTYCSRSPSCNLHRDLSTWPESNRGLFSQKDEKLHTAGLDDTAILLIEIKLTEILRKKKSSILQYHKPRFSPQYSGIIIIFFSQSRLNKPSFCWGVVGEGGWSVYLPGKYYLAYYLWSSFSVFHFFKKL